MKHVYFHVRGSITFVFLEGCEPYIYILFRLILLELRTERMNLAFQFEDMEFLRNVLRVYGRLQILFHCFHEDIYRHSDYHWVATTLLSVSDTVTIFAF